MELTLIALAAELPGLQAARDCIDARINHIQEALSGHGAAQPALTLTAPKAAKKAPAKKAAPISDAKRLALEKARATLAARRKQEAAGKGKAKKTPAKKTPAKKGVKAGAKKVPAKKPGNAAASKQPQAPKVMAAGG